MGLYDKIQAKLKGTADKKKLREEILKCILDTFQQGSPDAVTDSMKSRLDEMERKLKEKLHALEKKL